MIMANTSYIQFVLTDVEARVTDDVAVVTCGENMLTDLPVDPDALPGEAIAGLAGGRAVATNVFRRDRRRLAALAAPRVAGPHPRPAGRGRA